MTAGKGAVGCDNENNQQHLKPMGGVSAAELVEPTDDAVGALLSSPSYRRGLVTLTLYYSMEILYLC